MWEGLFILNIRLSNLLTVSAGSPQGKWVRMTEPLALMTSHKLGTIMTKLRVVASYGGCHLEGACKYGNKHAPGAGQREQKGWADGVWVDGRSHPCC